MKIKTWIKYTEGYLPTSRCRKLRFRKCEDFVDIELKEISKQDTQLAYMIGNKEIVRFNDTLYTEVVEPQPFYYANDDRNKDNSVIGRLKHSFVAFSSYFGSEEEDTRDRMIAKAEADMNSFLLIDNVVWQTTGRPVYKIMTFGLGNNHAETTLYIAYTNTLISSDGWTFEGYERDIAVRKALSVATKRGDTNSIDHIEQVDNIECFNISNKQLVEELKIKGYVCTNYSDNTYGQSVAYYEDKNNVLKITSEWVKVDDNHYTAGNVISIEDVTECYK